MIFLRSARFFRRFLKYVCPAFSAPGFRSGVLRTGGKRQRSEIGRQNAEDEIAGFCEVVMPCNIIHVMALREQSVNFTKIGIVNNLRYPSSCYPSRFRNIFLRPSPPKRRRAGKAAQAKDNGVSACLLRKLIFLLLLPQRF